MGLKLISGILAKTAFFGPWSFLGQNGPETDFGSKTAIFGFLRQFCPLKLILGGSRPLKMPCVPLDARCPEALKVVLALCAFRG